MLNNAPTQNLKYWAVSSDYFSNSAERVINRVEYKLKNTGGTYTSDAELNINILFMMRHNRRGVDPGGSPFVVGGKSRQPNIHKQACTQR